jgi:hypothetical protein
LENKCGLNGQEEAGRVEELDCLVSEDGIGGFMKLTGCAEKKISFCERMAPQMIAASCCMLVRFDPESVLVGRTYDPDASLCNSCSAYEMSVKSKVD